MVAVVVVQKVQKSQKVSTVKKVAAETLSKFLLPVKTVTNRLTQMGYLCLL